MKEPPGTPFSTELVLGSTARGEQLVNVLPKCAWEFAGRIGRRNRTTVSVQSSSTRE